MKPFFKAFPVLLALTSGLFAQDSILVFQDEFNYNGAPNPDKWTYEIGYIRNNEAQYYTNRSENIRVENDRLIIEARNDNWEGHAITSASLISKGMASWTYGRFHIQARFDVARGTWPALWLLSDTQPYGTWPRSGEIDIMENVGFEPNTVHGTVHTEAYNHVDGTAVGQSMDLPALSSAWHTFSVGWSPDSIHIFADGVLYMQFGRHGSWEQWPFDHPFYLIMNLAIGGGWGGQQGVDLSAFPLRMEVDYVRIYKYDDGSGPFALSIDVADPTFGSVQKTPSLNSYSALSSVELTAIPEPGYEFQRWSDGNRDNPRSLIMDHDLSLTAHFALVGERIATRNFLNGFGDWFWWNDAATPATLDLSSGEACLTVQTAGQDWQVQLDYPISAVVADELYVLDFVAHASKNSRPITATLRMNHQPYGLLASSYSPMVTSTSTRYTHQFAITSTDISARLEFDIGQDVSTVCFQEISLIRTYDPLNPVPTQPGIINLSQPKIKAHLVFDPITNQLFIRSPQGKLYNPVGRSLD
jgi:beta-glucanase (GH16 family)